MAIPVLSNKTARTMRTARVRKAKIDQSESTDRKRAKHVELVKNGEGEQITLIKRRSTKNKRSKPSCRYTICIKLGIIL